MRKTAFTLIVFLCVLHAVSIDVNATKVPGYIITGNNDTIYGLIKLRNINQTGILLINGFDMESLHTKVIFRKKGNKSFQSYFPDTINGFGFTINSTTYIFRSFLIEYNSIFYKDQKKYRFLSLVYDGYIDLYQDIMSADHTKSSFAGERTNYYEYFIGTGTSDLVKAQLNENTKTVREILQQFEVDERYLNRIPESVKLIDLKILLENYDKWLLVN